MVPTLSKRYLCGYNYDYYGNCYTSTWDSWGRWVAIVLIIIFVLFLIVLLSCINARRRRRAGLAPRYGTGWAARSWANKPPGGNDGTYYNQPYNVGAPAPPYSPPVQNEYTGNTFNSNEGYFGQQSGIELQHPQHTYAPQRGGQQVYEAPQGPPPNKGGY